jgi:hypothetical protein
MFTRIYLLLLAVVFIGYGLYCLVMPESLSGPAGISALTITGTIELQVMYGGLQTAVGALCLFGALNMPLRAGALQAMLFIFVGLGVPRVTLALVHGDFSAYTVGASAFELFSAVMILLCLRAHRNSQ